jgi:hypothetical protein
MSGLIGARGEPLYPPESVADQTLDLSAARARIAELEAALHKINALIDSPACFNANVQAVLDSVIDTSDTKFA